MSFKATVAIVLQNLSSLDRLSLVELFLCSIHNLTCTILCNVKVYVGQLRRVISFACFNAQFLVDSDLTIF